MPRVISHPERRRFRGRRIEREHGHASAPFLPLLRFPPMREEVLHRAEQIESKAPALWLRSSYFLARQHFRKKRMAQVPRRILILKHTSQIGDHRLVIGLAQF